MSSDGKRLYLLDPNNGILLFTKFDPLNLINSDLTKVVCHSIDFLTYYGFRIHEIIDTTDPRIEEATDLVIAHGKNQTSGAYTMIEILWKVKKPRDHKKIKSYNLDNEKIDENNYNIEENINFNDDYIVILADYKDGHLYGHDKILLIKRDGVWE